MIGNKYLSHETFSYELVPAAHRELIYNERNAYSQNVIMYAFFYRKGKEMIPIIGFVGYSNSGKTLVVANMIKILSKRGYRVAAIKHASHGYDMDVPGKDSWQHYESGAEKVVLVGPSSYTMHQRCSVLPSLNDVLSTVTGVDLILLEGFKTESVSKVVIIRKESPSNYLEINSDTLAVVSDMPGDFDVPLFSFEQLDSLADLILDTFVVNN